MLYNKSNNLCPVKVRFIKSGILLLFLILCPTIYATTDTTKIKKPQYDLNDPRNPNCPCHKYQKLAEEEYALKDKENIDNQHNKYKKTSKHDTIASIKTKPREVIDHSEKIYQPQHRLWINKLKFRFISLSRKLQKIKFSTNNHLCFKWN